MTRLTSARLGLVCVTLAVFAGTAARAEEGVAIKNLLGSMGVIPAEKDPIRYRERAPLVLPPKMELREPASAETYASANPQWPNDPDVAARKRKSAEQRRPVTESEIRRMSERNPTLSIDEMRQGRTLNAQGPTPGEPMSQNNRAPSLSPDDLTAGGKKQAEVASNAEASRRTLTEPPTGFRKTSSNYTNQATYTPKIDQQEFDANPINWLTRKFHRSDDDE